MLNNANIIVDEIELRLDARKLVKEYTMRIQN